MCVEITTHVLLYFIMWVIKCEKNNKQIHRHESSLDISWGIINVISASVFVSASAACQTHAARERERERERERTDLT